jgi:putative peptide zinc metalloprotease protein
MFFPDGIGPMSTPERLSFNPAVEVATLDSSAREPMAICSVPLADEGMARHAVPQRVLDLLRLFDGSRSTPEVIAEYGRLHPGRHREEAVEKLIRSYLLPKQLLLDGSAGAPAPPLGARRSYLTFRVRLLSARTVHPIARALGWMFARPVFATWMLLVIWIHWDLYARLAPEAGLDLARVTGGDVLLVALMTTVSVFVHELGHAAAAVHYGCKRTEIGWGLYLYFSVFYTDVSEAWTLPRRQRAVVDLAGIYFQSVFMAVLLAAYHFTGSTIWLYGILASDIGIAHSLNPFLRMDGYWLLSDGFGIVNLRAQTGRMLQVLVARITGKFRSVPLPSWNLDRRSTLVLAGYTVFSLSFFVYLYVVLTQLVVFSLARSLPEMLSRLYRLLMGPSPQPLPVAGAAIEVVWRALMLYGIGYFTYQVLRSVVRWFAACRRMLAASVPLPSTNRQVAL